MLKQDNHGNYSNFGLEAFQHIWECDSCDKCARLSTRLQCCHWKSHALSLAGTQKSCGAQPKWPARSRRYAAKAERTVRSPGSRRSLRDIRTSICDAFGAFLPRRFNLRSCLFECTSAASQTLSLSWLAHGCSAAMDGV